MEFLQDTKIDLSRHGQSEPTKAAILAAFAAAGPRWAGVNGPGPMRDILNEAHRRHLEWLEFWAAEPGRNQSETAAHFGVSSSAVSLVVRRGRRIWRMLERLPEHEVRGWILYHQNWRQQQGF